MRNIICKLEEKIRHKYFGYRKNIHLQPELSGHEEKTSELVAEVLKSLNLEVRTGVGGFGVVGILEGKKPGRVVGLRADMDALSISEKNDVPWKSEIDGVMHACGHDTHTAMLLGAAHVLSEMTDRFDGKIVFIFQPAEENPHIGGAQAMIREGVLDDPKVDAMLGLHIWPTLKTGTIGLQSGAVSAASDPLKISVYGKATHASMPHLGIDAVVIGSAMVMALQTIISRNIDANESAVLTLGTVHGGDRYNITADKVTYEGTVRTLSSEVRKKTNELIQRIAQGTCKSLGGECDIQYTNGLPSSINHPVITSLVQKSVKELLGEENLLTGISVNLVGEDFAYFSERVPSAYAWLGCCPADISFSDMPPLHNDKFLPDENSLPIGVCFIAAAALGILKGDEALN